MSHTTSTDCTRFRVAIKLLNDARDLIEHEARLRNGYETSDGADLSDAAEDLGPILCTLESFTGSE